jgi:enolase
MKFFEKVNSQNLKTIDQKLATSILLKMQEIGFSLTDSDDLNAIESASNLRNNFLLNLQPD